MKPIIVDERISEKCLRGLMIRGFDPITLPPDPALGEAVASHPDTVLLKLGDEIFTTADYCDAAGYVFSDIRERAPHIRVSFTSDIRKSRYPEDCKMNALIMGKKLFAKLNSLSEAVIAAAKAKGYELINTTQGYPACTVLALNEHSAITADRGMAKALSENGIAVTLIREGYISLPPHDYGFIGGASGVYHNKVYFFGNLASHTDCDIIEDAVKREGLEAVSLSDEPLLDLGGIVFL